MNGPVQIVYILHFHSARGEVAYQPSPYESDKLLWLENFETLLSEVATKWDGIIIITGDINIDLIGEQKESTKRYKNIHSTFISI